MELRASHISVLDIYFQGCSDFNSVLKIVITAKTSGSTTTKDRATDIWKWWSIYVSLEEMKVTRFKLNKSNSLIGK